MEARWIHLGKQSVRGCTDCHRCKDGACVSGDGIVNERIEKMRGMQRLYRSIQKNLLRIMIGRA